MPIWSDILARLERYRDLRREVEKELRVRQMLARCDARDHLYHRLLACLGCPLVSWGCRLQERHGPAVVGGAVRCVKHAH